MKRNAHKGLFVVFEGLDGSGSSTQADLLTTKLNEEGYSSYATKEPTNNIIGGLIRGQLTGDWKAGMECLQLLFAADRAHHLDREIIPAVKSGRIIISDRYFFSTVAYGSLELDRDWLVTLNQKFLYPDVTFLIKVPPRECLRRMKESRFELELFEQEQKLARVWRTYDWLAKRFHSVYVLDGTSSRVQLAAEVFEIVKKVISKKNIECKKNLL